MEFFLEAISYLDSQPSFFTFLFWTSLVLAGLLTLTYLYLLISRINHEYVKFRKLQVVADWQQIFNAVRKGEEPLRLPPTSRSNRKYLLELWLEERAISGKRNAAALDELASRMHLAETICNILRPGKMELLPQQVWLHALAINAARHIDTVNTRKAVHFHANSDNLFLAAQACACLASNKIDGYEKAIMGIMFRFPGNIPDIFDEVSKAGGADVLLVVQPLLDRLPHHTRMNFISLAANSGDERLVPLLKDRLQVTNSEEEIAAILRLLGKVGDSSEVSLIETFLEHPTTFVRIQAVRAIGRLAQEYDVQKLIPLLSDSEWWLRYRTARALMKLLDGDMETFENIQRNVTDNFAKQIINHAREEIDWCAT